MAVQRVVDVGCLGSAGSLCTVMDCHGGGAAPSWAREANVVAVGLWQALVMRERFVPVSCWTWTGLQHPNSVAGSNYVRLCASGGATPTR